MQLYFENQWENYIFYVKKNVDGKMKKVNVDSLSFIYVNDRGPIYLTVSNVYNTVHDHGQSYQVTTKDYYFLVDVYGISVKMFLSEIINNGARVKIYV